MDFKLAINKVEKYYGMEMDWTSRKSQPMEQRAVLVHILLEQGYHVTQVADLININRTTVIYHRNTMNDEYYIERRNQILGMNIVDQSLTDFADQAKYNLIRPYLDKSTIAETRELANIIKRHLQAKEWKNEDKITVIDCSTGIGDLVF